MLVNNQLHDLAVATRRKLEPIWANPEYRGEIIHSGSRELEGVPASSGMCGVSSLYLARQALSLGIVSDYCEGYIEFAADDVVELTGDHVWVEHDGASYDIAPDQYTQMVGVSFRVCDPSVVTCEGSVDYRTMRRQTVGQALRAGPVRRYLRLCEILGESPA